MEQSIADPAVTEDTAFAANIHVHMAQHKRPYAASLQAALQPNAYDYEMRHTVIVFWAGSQQEAQDHAGLAVQLHFPPMEGYVGHTAAVIRADLALRQGDIDATF